MNYKRFLFNIVLFTVTSFSILEAQPIDSTSQQKNDTTIYDFIFLDTKYQNQFTFWGRDYGEKLPYSTSSILYYFNSNIWLGVSDFHFFNSSIPEQVGGSIGFYKEFTPKTDLSTSYTQFLILDNNIPASSRSQGYAQTTFGLDWGLLYSTLQAQVLINNSPDIFFSAHHSRYFQFNQKLFKKILVSFEPKLSLTFGSNNFDYATTEIIIAPGGGAGSPVGNTANSDQASKLKMLDWEFTFPLKFELGKLTIEPSWKYAHPLNTVDGDPSQPVHLFNVDINYFWPIPKHKNLKH